LKDANVIIVTLAVATVLALALIIPQLVASHPAFQSDTVSTTQAVQMMRIVPEYANIIQSNNTVIFTDSNIRLVVLAIGHEGLANLTANSPPGYATDDVFVIYGLADPTLIIPHDATVQIVLVNLDSGIYHSFVITSFSPPYSYMSMHGMKSGQSGFWAMMPFIPPTSSHGVAHEYSYSVALRNPETLWYLCSYPGHAQNGMYGRILVA